MCVWGGGGGGGEVEYGACPQLSENCGTTLPGIELVL